MLELGFQEGRKKNNRVEELCDGIMTSNFPRLMKGLNLKPNKFYETQRDKENHTKAHNSYTPENLRYREKS